jgi:glucosamine--fructose-6-phosphate aminotransferase (isomerizing)
MIARYAIERWARVPVEVEVASEFRYRDPVLPDGHARHRHHAVGRDGRHAGRDAPRREQGATVVAVTNVDGSQATRDADARCSPAPGSRSASRRRRRSSRRSRRCTCSA